MRLSSRTVIAWAGIMVVILAIFGVGLLWLGRTPETEATNSRQDSSLPEHPLEHMGIAKLTESQGIPEDAITEAEAIDLVIEATWGPHRDFYLERHPALAMPATYDAEENTMGPAADNLPVWVVVLEGWGRQSTTCGNIGPQGDPENPSPRDDDDCITVIVSAYSIVDAVTGNHLAGWHHGKREMEVR